MTNEKRAQGLKLALITVGSTCFLIYPLALIWPSGWVWHGGHGMHYFQMICGIYATLGWFLTRAARAPENHTSLIKFTIWSSIAHATIMILQVGSDHSELGHLSGDIPALLLIASVLWALSPREILT